VALGSIWKAASYTGAITTALVVLAAHILGSSRFPRALLFPVLALSWITLIAGESWIQDVLIRWNIRHPKHLYICMYMCREYSVQLLKYTCSWPMQSS
jgi:hypothetical protein